MKDQWEGDELKGTTDSMPSQAWKEDQYRLLLHRRAMEAREELKRIKDMGKVRKVGCLGYSRPQQARSIHILMLP